MCGIAGIVGHIDARNHDALRRMNDALAHRGPDGEGYWTASPDARGWGAMLAHRRLSILDLSPAGAQPMVDAATGQVLVTNGEIYNYVELRERLVAAGHRFESTGDTAVMLRTLGVHGREALGSLRGMFACALWDPGARRLLLARDALGIKPLYLAVNPDPRGGWGLAFASEVRALLASGLLGKPRLHPRAAASIVWNGFMVGPDTAVRGIEAVSPGQWRAFDGAGRPEAGAFYWSADRQGDAAPVDEDLLAGELEDCVRLHLASDVPLGVFLSGGVDSSAVANLARRASRAPVHTFTLAFEEAERNEGPMARRVAQAIGTQHREVLLTGRRFVEQLDAALDSLDQPTFDGLNAFYLSQAVREAGFKVALVGTGGDELFGGYASFRDLPAMLAWSRRTRWVPRRVLASLASLVPALLQASRGAVPPQTRWAKLPEMVRRGDDLLSLYQTAYALFLPDFQEQLLSPAPGDLSRDGLPGAMRDRLRQETGGREPLPAISVLEQRLFLGERLLRDTDAASMAASIEIRLPLVDAALFRRIDGVAAAQRFGQAGRKSLLRRIGLRGLDPRLFERPKAGFELPFDRWIRAALGDKMDQVMRDAQRVAATGLNPATVRRLWTAFREGAPGIYWTRVWAIYAFVRWCERRGLAL